MLALKAEEIDVMMMTMTKMVCLKAKGSNALNNKNAAEYVLLIIKTNLYYIA